MSSLDDLMREKTVTAITIWPCSGGFQCNVRRKTGTAEGWTCITDADPVHGIRRALEGRPTVDEDLLI